MKPGEFAEEVNYENIRVNDCCMTCRHITFNKHDDRHHCGRYDETYGDYHGFMWVSFHAICSRFERSVINQ